MASDEVATWFAAGGTAILAFVAIFQEWLRGLIWRPKLELDASTSPPCSHRNILKQQTPSGIVSIPGYYIRLCITNTGSRAARRLEVYATELKKRMADGGFVVQTDFEPLNLAWSHREEETLEILLPEMSKYCGLGRIYDPSKRSYLPNQAEKEGVPSDKTIFSIAATVVPFTGTTFLAPGSYRLAVQLAAENVKPQTHTIEINHTGNWHADEQIMLGEGIGLQVID